MVNYTKYGLIIFIIILSSYIFIFFNQYGRINQENQRLLVLNSRIALFLPFYSFFMFISLLYPDAFLLLKIPYNIIEAYSFYLFFSLLVCNFKTVKNLLLILYMDSKSFVCCYNHKNYLSYYKKLLNIFFHFLITRSVFIILSVIFTYLKLRLLIICCELTSTFLLFYSLIHIVILYENLFRYCKNLYGILKFFLLKVSVGTVVIMGLVQTILIEREIHVYNDDDNFSAVEKIQRTYYFLSLLIFAVLTIPYIYAFNYQINSLDMSTILNSQSLKKIQQNQELQEEEELFNNSFNQSNSTTRLKKKSNPHFISPLHSKQKNKSNILKDTSYDSLSISGKLDEEFEPSSLYYEKNSNNWKKISIFDYLCQILNFSDVFGSLNLDENEDYESLNNKV